MVKIKAVYPGTFDPVTSGHVDLIRRGAGLFGGLVVAVAENPNKEPLFSLKERVAFIEEATKEIENVEVLPLGGLLVDFVHGVNATVIIKGLRAISDFEYELQLCSTNRRLAPYIETVFMTPAEEFSYISSTIVKEVARLNGEVGSMAPPNVVEALSAYYRK